MLVWAYLSEDPFGHTILSSGSLADVNPFGFSTKYRDAETGLVYFGYRYFDVVLARWISRDSLGEQGGENLYAHSRNDQVNGIDPLGQDYLAYTASSEEGKINVYYVDTDEIGPHGTVLGVHPYAYLHKARPDILYRPKTYVALQEDHQLSKLIIESHDLSFDDVRSHLDYTKYYSKRRLKLYVGEKAARTKWKAKLNAFGGNIDLSIADDPELYAEEFAIQQARNIKGAKVSADIAVFLLVRRFPVLLPQYQMVQSVRANYHAQHGQYWTAALDLAMPLLVVLPSVGQKLPSRAARTAPKSPTTVYRVVSESEYKSLGKLGRFTAPPSGGSTPLPGEPGKWFWGSLKEAKEFAPYWYRGEPYRIIKTTIPPGISPAHVQGGVDNIGQALFYRLKDLEGAVTATVR